MNESKLSLSLFSTCDSAAPGGQTPGLVPALVQPPQLGVRSAKRKTLKGNNEHFERKMKRKGRQKK
jgi:hypothetical protein